MNSDPRSADAVDQAVAAVIERGVFVADRQVKAFETEFAAWVGRSFAVGVASGGVALMIALRALGVGPGSRVLTLPSVDISVVAPILHLGATVAWADVDPATAAADADSVGAALAKGDVAALLLPHLYGNPAPVGPILERARVAGVPVLEDGSQATGSIYRGQRVGSFGQVSVFSLTAGKPLGTVGYGGAVLTDDPDLAERMRVLAHYGFDPESLRALEQRRSGARFAYREAGYSAAMDELHGAVLRVRLRALDAGVERRQAIAAQYRELLAGQDLGGAHLVEGTRGASPSWRHLVVTAPDRDGVERRLAARGVVAYVQYVPPLHRQPLFSGQRHTGLPGADRLADTVLCLPGGPELSDMAVQAAAKALVGALRDSG